MTHGGRTWPAAALAVAALLTVGCGGGGGPASDLPDDAVAKVGDTVITRAEFTDRLRTIRIKQTQMPDRPRRHTYDPPDYDECIASKRRQPVPSGQPEPKDDDLRQECEKEFREFKGRAMGQLIEEEWIRQETSARGIEFTAKDAAREFAEFLKREGLEKKREYRDFLRTSGQTKADVLRDLRADILEGDLAERVMETAPKVTDADVERYYKAHRAELADPERRDLNAVLAKNEMVANKAKRAVEDGASWQAVATRYSIDPDAKKTGGRFSGVTKGRLGDDSIDRAVFAADEGKVKGPVETQFGWFVFEVTKIEPPSGRSLDEAREDIRERLRDERRKRVLDAFNKRFQKKYEAITICAEGFEVPDCSNG